MDEVTTEQPKKPSWPSIDDAEPSEEGGSIARTGFNYQDEIAVGFLINMLETDTLLKVHCETHDDIVLLWQSGSTATLLAEYVQVKGGEADKLWSIADVCTRKKGKEGTSIFETSLGRDKHAEATRFRIVTLRPVVSELKPLTFQFGTDGRSPDSAEMKTLCAEFEKRFPGTVSPKGGGCSFWLENCFWEERHTEEDIRRANTVRLIQISVRDGQTLLPEQADMLLDILRIMAKDAGAAKWKPDPTKKIISREAIGEWWKKRLGELAGAAAASGGKLVSKMTDAALPDDVIALASELRRGYSAASRTSRYLEPDEVESLQQRVCSEVMSLRSQFIAGELDVSAAQFHARCLERMDAINAERATEAEDQAAFLKGCMYDIADRCLLRFARNA